MKVFNELINSTPLKIGQEIFYRNNHATILSIKKEEVIILLEPNSKNESCEQKILSLEDLYENMYYM